MRSLLGYPFWPAWEQWLMGNALTQLVVTPAILYWVVAPWRVPAMDRGRWAEAAALTAGLVVSGYLAFTTGANGVGFSEPLFYAPVPFMFWAAIRFGIHGASGAVIIVTLLCVGAALGGRGPYSGLTPTDTALALQHFLLLRAVPLYLVAILIEQNAAVERSLREREAEAHRQRIELAHAGRVSTMGQLATSIAHELYQPLGAILQNAEAAELVLERRPLDESELRAILADIQRDDRLAASVIGRMRSMLGQRELQFEALPVLQLLDEAQVLARAEMRARGVALDVELPSDLPPVRGDRVHLLQVLLNLFMNGADAMHGRVPGERRLGTAASRIDERTVEIAVSDSGYGIAAEHLPRIFDPFFTTKLQGMGMGLALSKAIVESHGGHIWAERNAHGGATFRFTLPTAGAGMVAPA